MFKKIKIKLLNISKKHHFLLQILRKGKFLIGRLNYIKFYLLNKPDENLIIFEAYMGRQYDCNPKAIYQELLNKKDSNFKYVWAFKKPEKFSFLEKNKNTEIVKYGSKEYYKTYAKAKFFISNSRIPEIILKKRNQIYIQTWHGTPLKKLGFDIEVAGGNAMNSIKDIQKKYQNDSKRYNYMISPSKFCTEKFISAFQIKNENILKEIGYPRNDYLYTYKKNEIKKIKSELNIPSNKKIILYAPTWRDNEHLSGVGYTYTLHLDFDKLKKEFEKEYIILFRSHYFVANQFDFSKYKGFVYNVSNYHDINELYVISDLLITDYSSVFFDFANLNKPILFYMYDYDFYKNNLRDFYIDLNLLPGPIIKEEIELIKEIKNLHFYEQRFHKKYQKFNKTFNYLNDGNASQRLIETCLLNKR